MKTPNTNRSSSPRKGNKERTVPGTATLVARVSRAEDGAPLLDFLSRHLRVSRKQAKALLDGRNVFVNRSRVWMARHKLGIGDSVEVPGYAKAGPRTMRTDILYEDAHYVVVNKPAGSLSNGKSSVECVYRKRLACDELRAVHRLDRDTTGCLLLARTPAAVEKAISIFTSREVTKHYHAVVWGSFPHVSETVDRSLDGRRAVTRVRRLDANRNASHLRLRIVTGRLHQVRRHLALLGYPVLGENRYGQRRKHTDESLAVARQMIHASSLAFRHPFTDEDLCVRAPLPPDFRACLKIYGLH